jgi:hypothetical protein
VFDVNTNKDYLLAKFRALSLHFFTFVVWTNPRPFKPGYEMAFSLCLPAALQVTLLFMK